MLKNPRNNKQNPTHNKSNSKTISEPIEVNSERNKLFCLKKNLFRPRMINGFKGQQTYFYKIAKLAKNVPAKTIHVPDNLIQLKNFLVSNF